MKAAEITVGNDYAVRVAPRHVIVHTDHPFGPEWVGELLLRGVEGVPHGVGSGPWPNDAKVKPVQIGDCRRARVAEVGVPMQTGAAGRKGVLVEMTGRQLRPVPGHIGHGFATDEEGEAIYDPVPVEAIIPTQNVMVDWAEVEAGIALRDMEAQAVEEDWATGRRFWTAHPVWDIGRPRFWGAEWAVYAHAEEGCPLARAGVQVRSKNDQAKVGWWGRASSCPLCFGARTKDVASPWEERFQQGWERGEA